MLKSDIEFLNHIKDESEFIIEHTSKISEEDFLSNQLLMKAMIRCFEIIGEASKKVNIDFKLKYNSIAWKEMAGMRDKIIHYYEGVDYSIV